jgi:hypothetical protein
MVVATSQGELEGKIVPLTGSQAGLMMAIKVRRLGGIVDGVVEYCSWRDFHRGQRVHMNRPSPLPFDPETDDTTHAER